MRLLKVGRDSNCDIVLHSDKASALHAEITILNNGDILLEDKNSRNGTFVMNRPIKPGTQVSIKRGDAIRFGDVELIWNQIPMPEDLSNYKAVYGIGTSMRNDIQIAGNTASRYHATLKIDRKGKAFLQDHSKNGSTINGERLNPGQTRQIKRGDAIVCGGVPVNLAQFIPSNNLSKIIGIAATIAILVVGGWAAWKYIPWNNSITPVTTQAMENASACVYGGYYYEINVKDDPFKNVIKGWPDKWYMGIGPNGKLQVNTTTDGLSPLGYTGTAFFISKDGEMGTNRHIAVPWEYRDADDEENIRQQMEKARQATSGNLYELLAYNVMTGALSADDANAWLRRYQNSPLEISGKHAFFGIGLTGSKVNNQIDLQQAQVIAESGDPKKDVALIRLNSRKTPDYIVKMGAIYDIEHARVDERSLKPQDEELTIIGYPMGETVANETFDGKELRPTIHKASLSKTPDDNQIQIQAVGIGGQSGSPVIDKSHRLVGVLCSGFKGTEVTYCCNIKHLVELYNKHRVRE
ncbi:forkhead-associated protein [Bacteroides sp. CAG:927]|jgi:putative adenylate cyclase|nr:forkhead-associated protein [Bacteroides sp. CAG:927]